MVFTDICVFGDSIGKGISLKPDSCHYETIKINLDTLVGRKDVNLKNYSMFGCTISKGLSIIKRHAQELKGYKNIFLEIGGNDCDFAWNEIAVNPEKDHFPKTPLDEFGEYYRQIIDEIQSNDGNPTILTLPPLEPNRFFDWVSRGINRDNIMKWLGDVNMIYRWQELYNIEVMLLASKMSIPIVDIRSAFLKCHNYSDFLCLDGIHPNKEGYEIIYKTVAEQFETK